jgi:hypothetical protein
MKYVISVPSTAAVWWCYRKIYIGFYRNERQIVKRENIDILMNTEYSA